MTKEQTLAVIRETAKRAATHRLAGRIERAMNLETHVDRMVAQAEFAGFGDDAFEAETAGQQEAHAAPQEEPVSS